MPQMDEYDTSVMPPMTKVALGNIKRTEETIARIGDLAAARHHPSKRADPDAWTRSKNKKYQKKMKNQRERK